MAEVVIKLPDEVYEDVKATYNGTDVLYCAVKYGKPLPKGHGRLIDENNILVESYGGEWDGVGCSREYVYCKDIYKCPTIVEADKGGNND